MPRTSRCWKRSSGYEEARRGNVSDVAVRCTTFDHMEAQITLRIPREWARALARRALSHPVTPVHGISLAALRAPELPRLGREVVPAVTAGAQEVGAMRLVIRVPVPLRFD